MSRQLNWAMRSIPPNIVTLPRVFGVEEGRGYTTIDFTHEDDERGDHLRQRIKKRRVRRAK